ncbi:hypothetical protein SAMN05428989_0810 [Pseudoxanthomonas sp. GM95]|uniref:alpha/beta hydrolase n=1 Tax=Pseudoxanthomonas sp. GM95 TaxID=1881043 RepID=UPI0008BED52D|nr:alpha/beta fold hydrolase [Pseudoxanthomonas sp. GM95]SEK79340.1 hypothetical protein SAMN05428989_0810 [Pseudoxanthomonas sp. GM95]
MKSKLLKVVVAQLALAIALSTPPVFAAEHQDPKAAANTLLDDLQANRFEAVSDTFTPEMARAVPTDKLAALWSALPGQIGALKNRGEPVQSTAGAHTLVTVPLHFERGELVALISVDAEGRVAGLLLKPASAPAAPPPPADAAFSERTMEVAGLPALLALPKGKGPFPAVVLVPGSGPQDLNETIGPNRPFLDVARGLAAQGIAVLRYDERTHARPQDFTKGDYGVDAETTDDAIAALTLLASTPGIDTRHRYVMGHSQGGQLAPRIAARAGKDIGVILWAAPARPLLDLLPEQNRYLLGLDGTSADDNHKVAELERQIRAIRTQQAPDPRLMGVPATYWRDTDKVDAIADLSALSSRVLWLQGGRDFQVTAPDWALWKKALASNKQAEQHFYPTLNHLGMAADADARGLAEYQQPGHVDAQLIDDVAEWIKQQ